MITQAFHPQAPAGLNIPTLAPAPVAPAPAPAPASQSPKPLSEKTKITQADAKSARF